jgi:RND family efflux transporter MFP subunit
VLAVLDARDLTAKGSQVAASLAAAQAMQQQAATHAQRMRALYAQDAAPKAQLDAAETGLAQADAAVAGARAGGAELNAVRDYSVIRAPFAGVVTRRFVDPGAFAAPGAPLVTIQDIRRLRVEVTAAPEAVRSLQRGSKVDVEIEGVPTRGVVEGTVPAGGSVYRVNAIVDNGQSQFLPGSAATVALPLGTRAAILIPANALRRQGDLTGVLVSNGQAAELRWVRIGRQVGDQIEIIAGLRAGEHIVIPARLAGAR